DSERARRRGAGTEPKERGGREVEIFTGILMGVVAGLLVKALFLKDSHVVWDAIFGVVGGVGGFYLFASLHREVAQALFAVGSGAEGRRLRQPPAAPGTLWECTWASAITDPGVRARRS